VHLLVLGLVAGLAAVERKGFLQAMLSRPIALAPLAGLALGDAAGGLFVAPPLELLWLGAVNMGAALPLHETLATAAIAGGAVLGGRALGTGVTGPVAVLAVLVCAPLALLGRNAERFGERRNERLAERAETALRCHDPRAATRMNLRGMLVPFVANALMAAAGAAAVGLVVPLLLRDAPGAEAALRHGWWAFCGVAAAAGARSLRSRRAGWTFTAAGAAVVLAGVLAWRGG